MKKPTTTTYAVLALLAVKPWSSYELAKQVSRSLRFAWPRAEGRIYDEPKLLVAHGWATASDEHTGKRPRTLYTITPQGRRALADWLAQPGTAPVLEYEALLKVAFAEQAGKMGLLINLRAIREQAEERRALGRMLGQQVIDGESPFPDRIPINSLMWSFLWHFHGMIADWADWAIAEVERWPDDLHPTPAMKKRALAVFTGALDGDPLPRPRP